MTTDSKKILFISHDASRTGAPLLLVDFLEWITRNHPDFKFDILLLNSGLIEGKFYELGKVYHLKNYLIRYLKNKKICEKNCYLIEKLLGIKYITRFLLSYIIKSNRYDLIYLNSLDSCRIVPYLLSKVNSKVLCHVHELNWVAEEYCGINNVRKALPFIDHFISVSDLVTNYLSKILNIPLKKISKVPGFARPHHNLLCRENLRQQLGIKDDAFVVCGSGTLDWRKGADIFVQILSCIKRCHVSIDNIVFIWVGGDLNSTFYKQLIYDSKKLNLTDNLIFVGTQENPFQYYKISNLLALTSREDPFPLVALEAAEIGLPIICFENASGSAEFINNNCGYIVPYLDVNSFSNAIISLQNTPATYKEFQSNIQKKSTIYNYDNISNLLVKEIIKILK